MGHERVDKGPHPGRQVAAVRVENVYEDAKAEGRA